MTKTTEKCDDDKHFVIGTLSRSDVRLICGDAVADRLSDKDMERLAPEMTEACGGNCFVQYLQHVIADKFSESSAGEEE
jgi:hypothetical protein